MDFPILSSLILLPSIGAIFIFFQKVKIKIIYLVKYISIFVSLVNFILSIYLWFLFDNSSYDFQFVEERKWLIGFVNYKVGVDGISILFIILTTFITSLCIFSVNNTVKIKTKGFFNCNSFNGVIYDRSFLLPRFINFLFIF